MKAVFLYWNNCYHDLWSGDERQNVKHLEPVSCVEVGFHSGPEVLVFVGTRLHVMNIYRCSM